MLSTAVHLPILDGAQSVDGLIGVEHESLGHTVCTCIRSFSAWFERAGIFLPQQGLSFCGKSQRSGVGIHGHAQHVAAQRVAFVVHLHVLWLCNHHEALLLIFMPHGRFHHMNNLRSEKLQSYNRFSRLQLHRGTACRSRRHTQHCCQKITNLHHWMLFRVLMFIQI